MEQTKGVAQLQHDVVGNFRAEVVEKDRTKGPAGRSSIRTRREWVTPLATLSKSVPKGSSPLGFCPGQSNTRLSG